ncbi:formate/nitrite transporter family protein [Gordonia sp. ABSL1-1]|uniref:formate/nitrite transporter family protein n=1 Tax=Gordonia sp. ABSL1-1 TaxID=3053923 RepID=UPI0025723275|nr:formate/nitrite transporter family protein [Gordonia sp. ABSL1-1]MDL9937688.1 formate/nitrite transporter family protein [Gordonia sp. ABSL1-1]
MTYVKPPELAQTLIDAGASKLALSTRDTLIRAYMGGAILTLAAAFAVKITVDTGSALVGALLFPIGFVLLYLLGYDLLTGVFVLGPLAWMAKRPGASAKAVLRNWGLVFLGNFAGALTVALLMSVMITYGFDTTIEDQANQFADFGSKLAAIGHDRTVGYQEHGVGGWIAVFVRGMLCNWMVSTAVIGAMIAKDVVGKIIVMWLPVLLFFAMGFEHSVVNMFLFPVGLMLGADFTVTDYLLWNELPTVMGNLIGGLLFTGLAIYFTHYRTAPKRSTPEQNSATTDLETVPVQTKTKA